MMQLTKHVLVFGAAALSLGLSGCVELEKSSTIKKVIGDVKGVVTTPGSSSPSNAQSLPAPRFLYATPTSPSNASLAPIITGSLATGDANSTVTLFRDSQCSQVIQTGSASEFTSPGLSVSVQPNKATAIYGQSFTTTGGSAKSACVLLTTFTHDNIGPMAPTLSATLPSAATAANASQNTNPAVKGAALPADAVKIRIFAGR